MADLGEGPIIAVDVKATFESSADGRPPTERRTRVAVPMGVGDEDLQHPRTPPLS